jgi:ankyrin repeat protein
MLLRFNDIFTLSNKKGLTALMLASEAGYLEIVKLLLAVPGINFSHEDYLVRENLIPLLAVVYFQFLCIYISKRI